MRNSLETKLGIFVFLAVLAAWALCFRHVLKTRRAERMLMDVRLQLCAVSWAALVLLPDAILPPGSRAGLDFVTERMSLAVGVLFCALVASVRLPRPLVGAMVAIAVVFFVLSYRDERALNALETQMEQAVAHLPPGQRVVSVLADPWSRVDPVAHLVDRICVGRCFSYANYEPSTAVFRVRAYHENPFVVSDYGESRRIQTGGYVVKLRDLPLYNIDLCEPGSPRVCVAPLRAGAKLRNTGLRVMACATSADCL